MTSTGRAYCQPKRSIPPGCRTKRGPAETGAREHRAGEQEASAFLRPRPALSPQPCTQATPLVGGPALSTGAPHRPHALPLHKRSSSALGDRELADCGGR